MSHTAPAQSFGFLDLQANEKMREGLHGFKLNH